jgi:ubiquitin C-terminal hydrolase
MEYQLAGIICHIGNAESGHYISYIKIDENKWVEFNDSIAASFSEVNI